MVVRHFQANTLQGDDVMSVTISVSCAQWGIQQGGVRNAKSIRVHLVPGNKMAHYYSDSYIILTG